MREEQIQEAPVKVLLVGVDVGEEPDFERSMEELASLAEAAEKEVAGQIVQRLDHVNKALYIGTGKVTEVRRLAEECGAQEIVFDNSLTPSQVRNLGNELELPIIDRTNLILDIFAIRAQTREAKLQVETARLQYMLPRLFLYRSIDLYFINIEVYSAVVNLIIITSQLGFHTFQLVSHIGQALFDGNDVFDALRLFQQLQQSLLFRLQGIPVTLQIHIGQCHILYILRTTGHIAQL